MDSLKLTKTPRCLGSGEFFMDHEDVSVSPPPFLELDGGEVFPVFGFFGLLGVSELHEKPEVTVVGHVGDSQLSVLVHAHQELPLVDLIIYNLPGNEILNFLID